MRAWAYTGSRERLPNSARWEPVGDTETEKIAQVKNHVRPCRDLIAAIEENRRPVCGLVEGSITIEMVMGVFSSHAQSGREVSLPLVQRTHPLLDFKNI